MFADLFSKRLLVGFLCLFWLLPVGAASVARLPALGADADQTSVSGLSSGAFMAAQYHIAHSADLIGVGIVAGGPWNCAAANSLNPFATRLYNAITLCMNPCKNSWFWCSSSKFPSVRKLLGLARDAAAKGRIDALENVRDDRVYLFSGRSDETVASGVVDAAEGFYQGLGVSGSHIRYNKSVDAGHGFITADSDDLACDASQSPYLNNCGFSQAERLLTHIYGTLKPPSTSPQGKLIRFDQAEFIDAPLSSMANQAFVYVPDRCYEKACRIHVAFHGCQQGLSLLDDAYASGAGYNPLADTNAFIVLYPQVSESTFAPINPNGCWDFWGYSSSNLPPYRYHTKDAPQMRAVSAMIRRLSSPVARPAPSPAP